MLERIAISIKNSPILTTSLRFAQTGNVEYCAYLLIFPDFAKKLGLAEAMALTADKK